MRTPHAWPHATREEVGIAATPPGASVPPRRIAYGLGIGGWGFGVQVLG